jgi:hypothetical protein
VAPPAGVFAAAASRASSDAALLVRETGAEASCRYSIRADQGQLQTAVVDGRCDLAGQSQSFQHKTTIAHASQAGLTPVLNEISVCLRALHQAVRWTELLQGGRPTPVLPALHLAVTAQLQHCCHHALLPCPCG